jgi:hypothetical protein
LTPINTVQFIKSEAMFSGNDPKFSRRWAKVINNAAKTLNIEPKAPRNTAIFNRKTSKTHRLRQKYLRPEADPFP